MILIAFLICKNDEELNPVKAALIVGVGYATIALFFYVWDKVARKKESS